MKKVILITSTYNGADYLPALLDSIFAQTYPNIDLYVRDDGSTDSGVSILRDYQSRTPEGKRMVSLDKPVVTIGKKKEETDVFLGDMSVSRLHARVVTEGDICYIEDLNSTNGTFKNGLRLQPYERRELEEGDEIRVGRVELVYR